MKKIVSVMLALMTCLMLTVPALAATNSVYVVGPQSAYSYGPWNWNGGYYWNGTYVVGPWNGDYRYVGPSGNYYVTNNLRGLNNFQRTKTYVPGSTYQDVPAGAWYETGVRTLYEMGVLAEGKRYRPAGGMTLNEVVSLAVRLHLIYNGWTIPAGMSELQYALNMGIVDADQYDNYADLATRRSFAAIMSKAIPTDVMRGVNVVMEGAIPDVPSYDPGASAIYTLYRAGILVGSDARGSFCPNDRITRASAAVITARMLDPSLRKGVSLMTAEATGLSLDRNSLTLYPSQSRTLTAYVYPLNAVNPSVSWASSNYSVATVDARGTVTAQRPGTALITATTATGIMASCTVQVTGSY